MFRRMNPLHTRWKRHCTSLDQRGALDVQVVLCEFDPHSGVKRHSTLSGGLLDERRFDRKGGRYLSLSRSNERHKRTERCEYGQKGWCPTPGIPCDAPHHIPPALSLEGYGPRRADPSAASEVALLSGLPVSLFDLGLRTLEHGSIRTHQTGAPALHRPLHSEVHLNPDLQQAAGQHVPR